MVEYENVKQVWGNGTESNFFALVKYYDSRIDEVTNSKYGNIDIEKSLHELVVIGDTLFLAYAGGKVSDASCCAPILEVCPPLQGSLYCWR